LLESYFRKEPCERFQRALKIYYDPAAMEKIPSHSLRAGLTGVLGTAGEPAINFILKAKTPEGLPKVKEIKFDDQNIIQQACRPGTSAPIYTNLRLPGPSPRDGGIFGYRRIKMSYFGASRGHDVSSQRNPTSKRQKSQPG
jgi:hypothetical protein